MDLGIYPVSSLPLVFCIWNMTCLSVMGEVFVAVIVVFAHLYCLMFSKFPGFVVLCLSLILDYA